MLEICCCVFRSIWVNMSVNQWSFGQRKGGPSLLSSIGVTAGQVARPGGFVGPQGQNAGNVGFTGVD